jgi:copper resistance protein B
MRPGVSIVAALLLSASAAMAQTPAQPPTPDPHAGHAMPAPQPAPATQPAADAAVPPLTDADRAAAFPPDVHGHTVHDTALNYHVLFDQLEWQYIHGAQGLRWDNTTWVGGDINRLWVKSEGEALDGVVDEAEIKVLFGRSLSRWWDVVAGVRQDIRPSPSHTWLAFGVQGLAPHWFEIDATLYVGSRRHTAARLEAEYEVLLTNRLLLQPLVEVSLAGKDDPDRGIGAGLSTGEVGFRLRYEIRREVAPYAGLVWHRKLFGTADFARAEGREVGGWHLVAGLRTWF